MEDITMRLEDTRRIAVLDKLKEKALKQRKAADILGVSVRQVRRLLVRYSREGALGIVHKLRGLPANHLANAKVLDSALDTIRAHYSDFSVTLAHEKLVRHHNFPYSRETLRLSMISAGMWRVKRKPKMVVHAIRQRRPMEGELIQIDGSPFDWFEGRSEYCNLLVFIDDATGRLKYLQFVPHETTLGYMAGMKSYIESFGKPLALYSDRHGIFRDNHPRYGAASVSDELSLTQFGRAMQALEIELIFANSPQAKGRVERVNQTLQGRLPKELRLLGINTPEEANVYLPSFIEEFNEQFGVAPASKVNPHIALKPNENLEEILVEKHTRVISKNLTISYENQIIQVLPKHGSGRGLIHQTVEVITNLKGELLIKHKQEVLTYSIIQTTRTGHIRDSKQLNQAVDKLTSQTNNPQPLPIDYEEPWLLFTPKPTRALFAITT